MIVQEMTIHQMTVEFKLLQVPLQLSIMNEDGPQKTKCEIIYKTQQST